MVSRQMISDKTPIPRGCHFKKINNVYYSIKKETDV